MDGNPEPSYLDISTTYVDWPSQFSQILLASNGFKYTGESDTVECVSCGIKISNWKAGDNVQNKHFRASPHCKYCKDISGRQNGNMDENVTTAAGGRYTNTLPQHLMNNTNPVVEPQRVLRSQFVPSRSESRLPVPVNIIQDISGSPRFRLNQEQSDADNSGNLQQQTTMPRAQIAQYQEESARLASYENWPDSAPVKPPALARAGLYYTGIKDKAKCPFCLGCMYNWEKGDIPLGEHAKHYPGCSFVKYKMYQNLLSDSSSSQENAAQQVVTDAIPRNPSPTPPPENTAQAVAAGGQDDDVQENVAVGIVHNMGYSMAMITEALKRISFESLSEVKSADLLDTLFEMEEEAGWSDEDIEHGEKSAPQSHHLSVHGEGDSEKPLMSAPIRNSPSPAGAHRDTEQHDGATFAGGNTPADKSFSIASPEDRTSMTQQTSQQPSKPLDPKYKELSDEHRKLTKRKICNICGQDEVSVLFLPCRHLVACETCSAKLKDCSQCDKLIIGTVKIYFP